MQKAIQICIFKAGKQKSLLSSNKIYPLIATYPSFLVSLFTRTHCSVSSIQFNHLDSYLEKM
ncbi:hypothetical protein EDM02_05380 [Candidatus Cardinium hertigii]|uniref:Uncharacterized protein n=1 Tax=Candidatus Cardinium hertigii TaxID=247481 RepID=A0A3N2QAZ7_9BACT|nr:hypothetical protein EDM02_05380 [Candidatus Cardinium hertigii]